MNKEFYKQRISEAINQSFIESEEIKKEKLIHPNNCLLYTSPSPRD